MSRCIPLTDPYSIKQLSLQTAEEDTLLKLFILLYKYDTFCIK